MTQAIPFKAILFDLDGTLVDSYPAIIRAWTTLANNHGLNPEYVTSVISMAAQLASRSKNYSRINPIPS
jgi:beta-phosphoglucomutase-like phosphatase (HAD superfamily)